MIWQDTISHAGVKYKYYKSIRVFFNSIVALMHWLFVGHFNIEYRRTLKQAILATILIGIFSFPFVSQFFKFSLKTEHAHSIISVEQALNNFVCNKSSDISNKYPIRSLITGSNTSLEKWTNIPLSSIPSSLAGTNEAYCKTLVPFINNENSLMFVMSGIFKLKPDITLEQLTETLVFLFAFSLLFSIFVLLRLGLSPLCCFGIFYLGCAIQHYIINFGHAFSIYPFLMIILVLYTSLIALILDLGLHKKLWTTIVVGFLLGLIGAFILNFRTSYLPIVILGYIMYLGFALLDIKKKIKTTKNLLFLPIAFLGFLVIGFSTFQSVFYSPIANLTVNFNRAYHVIGHSLVLGLAVPENELSRRENIKWEDITGDNLAKKIDPKAKYLGANYEKALLTYYMKLWIYYPQEMLDIYINKWMFSVVPLKSFISATFNVPPNWFISLVSIPLYIIENGIIYSLILGLLAIFALLKWNHWNIGFAFFISMLASASFLLVFETAIINPGFSLIYQNSLLLAIFIFSLCFYQWGINLAAKSTKMFLMRWDKC